MSCALLNVLMNTALATVFVILSNRALSNGLEETLVAIPFLYGLVVIVANAAFTRLVLGRRQA